MSFFFLINILHCAFLLRCKNFGFFFPKRCRCFRRAQFTYAFAERAQFTYAPDFQDRDAGNGNLACARREYLLGELCVGWPTVRHISLRQSEYACTMAIWISSLVENPYERYFQNVLFSNAHLTRLLERSDRSLGRLGSVARFGWFVQWAAAHAVYNALHFTSLQFSSLHYTSFHFTSFHFTSFHFT